MKSKKIIIIMTVVTVLLITAVVSAIFVFQKKDTDLLKTAENIENAKIANVENSEVVDASNIENNEVVEAENSEAVETDNSEIENVENNEVENVENVENTETADVEVVETVSEPESSSETTIQETRMAVVDSDETASSRSSVDRESVYVNSNPEAQPESVYDELEQHIGIEDVQISFDMDVSVPTGLSREDFITFVQNMRCDSTGILARNAGFIWDCCQKYSVNEIFVLGICGIESGWCSAPQHQNTHNYSSLMSGGHLIPYSSDEEGFEAMISLLGLRYLSPNGSFYHGATITGVGTCYCNPTTWPNGVFTCMRQALN